MEIDNFLPPTYREAIHILIQQLALSPVEEAKEIFEIFSKKYTVLSCIWIQRIHLEMFDVPFTREVYFSCLKLEKMAMQHFYHPKYISDFPSHSYRMFKIMSMGSYNNCYRLPEVDGIEHYCLSTSKDIFLMLQYQRLENFLTFPHSQLRAFYRYHQFHSAKPLPDDIKEKYEKSIESYHYMITIAMDAEKWLEWMQMNFDEEYWIRNLEAKLDEHWFMKEIWIFYFEFLDGKNDMEVLNVYKRYCRLFIEDESIHEKYASATLKYFKLGKNVTKWLFDQAKFEYDFGSVELGLAQLNSMLERFDKNICEKCFTEINESYLFGEPKSEETKSLLSCFWKNRKCDLCIDSINPKNDFELIFSGATKLMFFYNDDRDRKEFFDSLKNLKSITTQNFKPIVKLQFLDSYEPPIPRTYLNYIIENANHNLLAKLYQTCKFFFIKKRILLCYQLYVSKTFPQTFIQNSCATNFSTLINHEHVEQFCPKVLSMHDWDSRTYLIESFSKICFCSLRCLRLGGQDLWIKEFEKIVQSELLEQVKLIDVRIYKDDESVMVIEEIIEYLPNVLDLSFRLFAPEMFTPETAQNLEYLDRTTRFESFELRNIPEDFELPSFRTFLERFMIPKGNLVLRLQDDIVGDFVMEFESFCRSIKNEWDPIYEAPILN